MTAHRPGQIGTHDQEGLRTHQTPGDVCLGCSDPATGRWVPVTSCPDDLAELEVEVEEAAHQEGQDAILAQLRGAGAVIGEQAQTALTAGLAWLFDTEQPAGALIQHHGAQLLAGDRLLQFVPRGWNGCVVVVVDTVTGPHSDQRPALRPDELDEWAQALTAAGHKVVHRWNGHPGYTGSLALEQPCHPTLAAAVDLYNQGCLDHPNGGVFCGCGWFDRGANLIVHPTRSTR